MDLEFNKDRQIKHWKHFMDGKEMPEGFIGSSYHNDTFPSIEHESNRVHIFFLDLDGWIGDISNDTTDFTKYILESHESEEVYGYSFVDDDPKHKILATDSWDEVLEAIEEWRKTQ